jgi:predicted phage tail protein
VGIATGRTDVTLTAPADARSLVQDNVPNGAYYVRVRALTPRGPTPPSNEVLVSIGEAAPPAPTNLEASVSGSRVVLSWSPAAGIGAQYLLEVGFAPGTSEIVMPVGARTSVEVTGVPPGAYYVRVRAIAGQTPSAASNEVNVVVR